MNLFASDSPINSRTGKYDFDPIANDAEIYGINAIYNITGFSPVPSGGIAVSNDYSTTSIAPQIFAVMGQVPVWVWFVVSAGLVLFFTRKQNA